jgi:hypothetical protein
MTERAGEPLESDDAIWQDATTLSSADTKDAKIHLSLRLDPMIYRAVLAEKRSKRDRTITATIERLLNIGLDGGNQVRDMYAREALRNLVVHSVAQDRVLEAFARHLKLRSKKDQSLLEEFREHRLVPEEVEGDVLRSKAGMFFLPEFSSPPAENEEPAPQRAASRARKSSA